MQLGSVVRSRERDWVIVTYEGDVLPLSLSLTTNITWWDMRLASRNSLLMPILCLAILLKTVPVISDPVNLHGVNLKTFPNSWEEVRDSLDPEGYVEQVKKSFFPGETFRVLEERELRQFGEYRTRRLMLRAREKTVKETSYEEVK